MDEPPVAAHTAPLGERYTGRDVQWAATGNVFVPFQAAVGGAVWAARLNEFPAEPMYTLFIDGREIGFVDDWPDAWAKPSLLGMLRERSSSWRAPWVGEVARRAAED